MTKLHECDQSTKKIAHKFAFCASHLRVFVNNARHFDQFVAGIRHLPTISKASRKRTDLLFNAQCICVICELCISRFRFVIFCDSKNFYYLCNTKLLLLNLNFTLFSAARHNFLQQQSKKIDYGRRKKATSSTHRTKPPADAGLRRHEPRTSRLRQRRAL